MKMGAAPPTRLTVERYTFQIVWNINCDVVQHQESCSIWHQSSIRIVQYLPHHSRYRSDRKL